MLFWKLTEIQNENDKAQTINLKAENKVLISFLIVLNGRVPAFSVMLEHLSSNRERVKKNISYAKNPNICTAINQTLTGYVKADLYSFCKVSGV